MSQISNLDGSERLALLSFAVRLLLADDDRETILDRGVEALSDFSGGEGVAIFLLDASGDFLHLERSSSTASDCEADAVPVEGSVFGAVLRSKAPESYALDSDVAVPFPRAEVPSDGKECLCVPLMQASNQVLGVVTVKRIDSSPIDTATLQSLLILQSILAVSLHNARVWKELREAHARLETVAKAQRKMIDHLSHELKTPLAIIASASRLLGRPSVRQDDARFEAILERARRSLGRLTELQTEAADIAKAEDRGEERRDDAWHSRCHDLLACWVAEESPTSAAMAQLVGRLEALYPEGRDDEEVEILLQNWVAEVVAQIAPLHRHRAVEVKLCLELCPSVRLPEAPLRKAVIGLIRNAIEATADGGEVRVELEDSGGEIELRVRDFGVGMDAELVDQLFSGFVHAGRTEDYSSGHPYDFKAGGVGLDLLRTKLFTERSGLRLGVSSEVGQGSLFTLELPASVFAHRRSELATERSP